MLWAVRDFNVQTKDGTGLHLFAGSNQPHWIGGVSQCREDGTCEYLGELSEADLHGLTVQPGAAVQVFLSATPAVSRPKLGCNPDYDQI